MIAGFDWPDKVFIIAELSCNHLGIYEEALDLIDDAAAAGADAVKIQLYTPETMTLDMDKFKVNSGEWAGKRLWDLYSEAETPWEWADHLQRYAESLGLKFIVSVYDPSSLEFAEKNLNVWAYKISSFELVDVNLLRQVAMTQKRVILSTGMAKDSEVWNAYDIFVQHGKMGQAAFLHCVTAYPTPVEQMNLSRIRKWKAPWIGRVGLSDHSLTTEVPGLAVAAGASIIEKHFTLNRSNGSHDSAFSLEPDEFKRMVVHVREVEAIMGSGERVTGTEEDFYRTFRRSVYAVKDIKSGDLFTAENTKTIRALGEIIDLQRVIGKVAQRDLLRGDPIQKGDFLQHE